MKIKSLIIKNFRSIVDCHFDFNDLFVLVGENNNGKSNIIDAIEMLLSKNKVNNVFDFYNKENPIIIEINFCDLTQFEKDKISEYLDGDKFILRKEFLYKEKENGDPDSESKMYYIKGGETSSTKAPNIFAGEILPEFYKVPAVRDIKEEVKFISTTYFGKFLDLLFESDDYDFSNLDDLLEKISIELKRTDDDAPLIKGAKEIEEIMCEQFRNCSLNFKIDTPGRKDLISQIEIFSNDGCETPLSSKGQGVQRAFIFSILLLYAQKLNNKLKDKDGKDKKDIIIAIDEPEIYLHPQQQRIIYNLFKKLIGIEDEQIQIIYTTHSSFMINIEDYKYLGLVTKNSVAEGTKITQINEDIFSGGDKEEFKTSCHFDPERNEMFFADKIIFCEGDTEKYSLPLIFDKLGINLIDKKISIIECGSKSSIPLFLKILNKFNEKAKKFKYYVFYDNDGGSGSQEIDVLMDDIKHRFIFIDDFEQYFSLTPSRKNKPYNFRKQILLKNKDDFPSDIKNFIVDNF